MKHLIFQLSIRRLLLLTVLAAAVVIGPLGFTQLTASAAPASVQKLKSASFGITEAQTARISVTNLSGKPIAVTMKVFDDLGSVKFICDGAIIGPDKTYWMDADGAALADKAPARAQLRAQFWVKTTDTTVFTNLLPSIEVFDTATGRTTAVYPANGAQ